MGLPIPTQPAYIEQAWRAGKHVLSEKPVAKDVAEASRLIELYEREFKPRGIQWIVMEQFAVSPDCVVLLSRVLADGVEVGSTSLRSRRRLSMSRRGGSGSCAAFSQSCESECGLLLPC